MTEHFMWISGLLLGTLRGATPLVFASLGGLFSERSGVVQIALEGLMLMGALGAAIVAYYSQNPYLGFLAGGLCGVVFSLVFSFFALFLKADQIIVGTAINILAVGLAPFVTKIIFDVTGSTPSLSMDSRFVYEPIIFAVIAVLVSAFIFYKTKWGIQLVFAGEAPHALQASGVSVSQFRWKALSVTGLLAGFGGACLSLFLASAYSPNMTSGRGFMALAALIFGKWRPLPTMAACVFFALIDSLQMRLQGGNSGIPIQFIQILPYVVTIIALSGFFGKSRAPKGLGQHVERI